MQHIFDLSFVLYEPSIYHISRSLKWMDFWRGLKRRKNIIEKSIEPEKNVGEKILKFADSNLKKKFAPKKYPMQIEMQWKQGGFHGLFL